jgi:hypothetical protein
MVQSFACNIQNNCGPLEDFQDIPTYPGSKLDVLEQYLSPIVYNETVLEFSKVIPKILALINATAKVVGEKHVHSAIQDGLQFQEMV